MLIYLTLKQLYFFSFQDGALPKKKVFLSATKTLSIAIWEGKKINFQDRNPLEAF